jgi:hypothetical protein
MADYDDNVILSPSHATVADHVSVGTEKILASPHVSEGPGRIANAPVPSVFRDDRGEIHRLRVGGERLNLLSSKRNVMRSGYLHPNNKHDFVFSGKVEVWTLTAKNTEKRVYEAGEHFVIPPYSPHILHFLEDTVIAEWWEPGPFRCWYYHPYRRIIDVQNSLVCRSTGVFQKLIPQDHAIYLPVDSNTGKLWWWTAGVLFGAVFGGMVVGFRHRK